MIADTAAARPDGRMALSIEFAGLRPLGAFQRVSGRTAAADPQSSRCSRHYP